MSGKLQCGIIVTMLQELHRQNIEKFFTKFEHKTYKKGETVIQPDETHAKGYFIKSGFVKNYTLTAEGIELTFHIFTPGTYFPMMSIISDIQNRFYYEALTDTEIYIAPKQKINEFLIANPEILFDLTSRLLSGMDKLLLRIEYLALETARKRLISTLLFLARHFGEHTDSVVRFKYTFTHRDLASFAGISRETTSREWEKLHKAGLVKIHRQQIHILDIAELTALLSIS